MSSRVGSKFALLITVGALALGACGEEPLVLRDASREVSLDRDEGHTRDAIEPVDSLAIRDVSALDAAITDVTAGDASADRVSPTTVWTDLCNAPPTNLLPRGAFEDGIAQEAPMGWEVRSRATLEACRRSGTPAEHLQAIGPAPGCTGRAIRLDARGQWDCYAVQSVTPYNSITPGRRYQITASVRSQNNAPRGAVCPECSAAWFVLGLQWLDGSDRFFGDEKNPRPALASDHDYGWRVLSWELVAPANARRALLWLTAHFPGQFDVDNVSIRALD
ncbi:MAG: hypothetical protein Q8Q09_22490 [Deltaproteobacteria bacterium]|nr:hypothetical protein [Deltaproteobacteria bacterium]